MFRKVMRNTEQMREENCSLWKQLVENVSEGEGISVDKDNVSIRRNVENKKAKELVNR